MLKYKVVIIDEDESRQEKVFSNRDDAIKCARDNRWSTIFSV